MRTLTVSVVPFAFALEALAIGVSLFFALAFTTAPFLGLILALVEGSFLSGSTMQCYELSSAQ